MRANHLLTLIVCLSGLVLGGCQNRVKAPPVATVVTPAPQQPSAKKPLSDARRIGQEADRRTTTASSQVDVSVTNVERYRDAEYAALHKLVSKAQMTGTVTTAELQEIIARVLAQKEPLEALLARLKQVQDELRVSRELRQQIDEKLTEALMNASAKEVEADQLRGQLRDQQATTKLMADNAQENLEVAVQAKSAAANAEGKLALVTKILVGVSIFALLSLIGNFLQFKRGIL